MKKTIILVAIGLLVLAGGVVQPSAAVAGIPAELGDSDRTAGAAAESGASGRTTEPAESHTATPTNPTSPAPSATSAPRATPAPSRSTKPTPTASGSAKPASAEATATPMVASETRPDHKPAPADLRERVPSDLKLPNGRPHPCAGRHLIYRTHTDAVYATRQAGELKIMTVAGAGVIDSDTICLRLGPDALRDGTEASRLVVPNDPNLTFLGKPGKIVWTAPQENHGRHQPLWAGMGAFDPSHENVVPDRREVPTGGLNINLVSMAGPGHLEVFGYNPGNRPNRYYSTREKRLTETFQIGAHAHLAWAFSAAGIYQTTWSATMTTATETVQSKPQNIYWLVGTDADVALPNGTTKPAETITKTTEEIRDQLGLPKVDDDETPEVALSDSPPSLTVAEAANQVTQIFGANYAPKDIRSRGTWTVSQPVTADEPHPDYAKYVFDGQSVNPQDYDFAIEVPDATMRQVTADQVGSNVAEMTTGGWVWGLDNPGQTDARVVFSARDFDLNQKNDLPIRFAFDGSEMPADARVVTGTWSCDAKCQPKFTTMADTRNALAGVEFTKNEDKPVSVLFNRPGVYSMTLSIAWNLPDGSNYYSSSPVTFYVGNAAINAGRTAAGATTGTLPVLAAGEKPQPLPIPGECAQPSVQPSPSVAPTPGLPTPTPTPTPGAPTPTPTPPPTTGVPQIGLSQAEAGWRATAAKIKHVFTHGHLDLALRADLTAAAHDTADIQKPAWWESGQLAVAVPDSAYGPSPLGAAFVLPQVQVEALPWVGFSTERIDYQKTGPISVSIKQFSGPGRLVQAHVGLISGFRPALDSSATMRVDYPERSHDHQHFGFTKPGLYQVDYRYAWATGDTTLRVTFLVGDAYAITGLKALGLPIPPGLGASTPADFPAGGSGLGATVKLEKPGSGVATSAGGTGTSAGTGSSGGAGTSDGSAFGRSVLGEVLAGGSNLLTESVTDGTADSIAPVAAPGVAGVRRSAGEVAAQVAARAPNRFYAGLAIGVGGSALVAGLGMLRRRPMGI